MFVKLSYIMVRKRRQCRWVSSKHLIWLRVATAGRAAGRGGEQQARGPLLLSPHYLALPICLFPSCASAFHLCLFLFFFNSLSFPLNDEKKNDSHRTQRIAKGRKARIIGLVPFHLFFLLSFLLFVL